MNRENCDLLAAATNISSCVQ